MRIRIFSHNSNPGIDRPILHKSLAYAEKLVSDGLALWLPDGLSVQALPPDLCQRAGKTVDETMDSHGAGGPLDAHESRLNATAVCDRTDRRLFGDEIRAMLKVRKYGKASWAYRGKVARDADQKAGLLHDDSPGYGVTKAVLA